MSDGGGLIISPSVTWVPHGSGVDGSARLLSFNPVTLYWINIGLDTDGEWLQLFEQNAAPVANDVPQLSIGRLRRDDNHGLYYWPHGLTFSSLAWGVSQTLDVFTPTANPSNYFLSRGNASAP